MSEPIPTQPEPEPIARAGRLLDAILAGDLALEDRLAVGAALATLYDVHPPYPPHPATEPVPIDLHDGVRQVIQALSEAASSAGSVSEAIRAGLAARELHDLRDWHIRRESPDRP